MIHTPFRPLRRRLGALAGALAAAALAPQARARAAGAPEQGRAAVEAALRTAFPGIPPIVALTPSPIDGLWEVALAGGDVLYVDATGRYLIQGRMLEVASRADLTERRIEQLTRVVFDELPLRVALVHARGSGRRRLAVFADPMCPYCKRLEREVLATLTDVTVYTLPLGILGQGSKDRVRALWCAPDRAAAWQAQMLRDEAPPPAVGALCDTAGLAQIEAAAAQMRVTATPTLIFEDGSRAAGMLGSAQLAERLARAAAARPGA